MPLVDVIDETFLVVRRTELAPILRDPGWWRRCWPGLTLTTYQDRGVEGLRWQVTGELVGTAEVWLEEWRDGVLVHVFVRADPPDGRGGRRRVAALRERHVRALKRAIHALKDELERDRAPGTPPPWAGKRAATPSSISTDRPPSVG